MVIEPDRIIDLKDGPKYLNIEVIAPDGSVFRLAPGDHGGIQIMAVRRADGGGFNTPILVRPFVTNVVEICQAPDYD